MDDTILVDDIQGTYMGYCDIEGERWFDLRESDPLWPEGLPLDCKEPFCLPSESRSRIDLVELQDGNLDQA